MGVPFEALLPYGIIMVMFGVTGVGLSTVKYYSNGRKNPRRAIDMWDKQMMERDRRITGIFRGQNNGHEAPAGFEVNNPWKTERRFY
ncbi:conserved hypothetical protein [Histoplasma mississippiense (nom. inval.)]|uniref:conserved hypothetical protein n=1 Tax=Ajellomyces capsulatus (strain NAm1 / WU24) TaxID=2059318 RepID=UPI000157B882|nr:conserved hypothetical protein [Histoplasma mississippiense (nom. inval.)]EDN03728.1 conserved hypothetical protein [Histoplasma mississippiense (nom. inval.)]